ncbi:MAG: hypothetical protein IKC69_03285 [Clostridia bacterium]|nr:hypothetical protein [Clostridia bacterium]
MIQAGFARVDVTPQLGTPLTGHFETRLAEGILDPLELNAVALKAGEDTVVVITGDFMYTSVKEVTRFRNLIAAETGLPLDCIFYQSLHQHTSTTPGVTGAVDRIYQDFLSRKFCDVVKMAIDDLGDAKVYIGQEQTSEPVAFIRRYYLKNGSIKTNPGYLNPDVVGPVGEADNTVRLVKFEREGKPDIAMVGFQNHPDMFAGKKISADWPGFVRRMTEARIANTRCILINGCQGDVNHVNVFAPNPAAGLKKGNPERIRVKYEFCRKISAIITDSVVSLWEKAEACEVDNVYSKVVYKRFLTKTEGFERIDEMKALYNRFMSGDKPTKEELPPEGVGLVGRIAGMENKPVVQNVPVSVVAFGKIAILGYAGEPFTEYAKTVRDAVPELLLFTACLANGAEGYLPSKESFAQGSYEVASTVFPPELPEVLQSTATEMLKEYLAQ